MTIKNAIEYFESYLEFCRKDGIGIPSEEPFIIAIAALQEKGHNDELRKQGRLVELPCDVGTRVYKIYRFCGVGAWEIEVHNIKLEDLAEIGKTIFFTREEAKKAIEARK